MADHDVILVAPPGAGKSTVLPLRLLSLACFKSQKIIMLQPRKVAVRAIAQHLAAQLGEPVGQTVGYRMRGEQKCSQQTRLEIVTEGLLTRMIQRDPELCGVGLIIFDEFHERNVHADFSLALCIEAQQGLREDLRLLIMSATLDISAMTRFLPQARLLSSAGKSYPVDLRYRPINRQTRLTDAMAAIIKEALDNHTGNILAFLPGAREINWLFTILQQQLDGNTHCHKLYGELTKQQQIAAIGPTAAGCRKIVLATNIAETSLTIEGISVVVDSGLEKVASYNLTRQLHQLETRFISKASSVQRAGRAGRVMAGYAYRLWSSEQQQRLVEQAAPQITQIDLAPLVLDAKGWGTDILQLPLLDRPSQAQVDQATQLLIRLAALDNKQVITAKGRRMAEFGCHPRLASMLITAEGVGPQAAQLACLFVAMFESRSLPEESVFVESQVAHLIANTSHPIWHDAKRWAKMIHCDLNPHKLRFDGSNCASLLLSAYPDTVAKHRTRHGYLLLNGTGADWPGYHSQGDIGFDAQWLVVIRMRAGKNADGLIELAHPLSEQQVLLGADAPPVCETQYYWHQAKQAVAARKVRRLGAITLSEQSTAVNDVEKACDVLLQAIRDKGLAELDLPTHATQWLERVALATRLNSANWPDITPTYLLKNLQIWLAPYLTGVTSWQALVRLNWLEIFNNQLDYQQQQFLNSQFPREFIAPSGRSHRLHYTAAGVSLSVRLQEMYGLDIHPTVGKGKLAVQLNLLSPAGRVVQTTSDLPAFWRGSYTLVQKDMKGRYPKHYWPDDPAQAVPTTRTKKNM